MRVRNQMSKQSGVMLLEALIGILLFSIGVLGIVSLQASSMKAGADATYRIEAGYLGNQIIGQMWADKANLPAYSLNATGAPCTAGANISNNPNVSGWINDMSRLPGSGNLQQQIVVIPASNLVTVTVCWLPPKSPNPHKLVVSSSIN